MGWWRRGCWRLRAWTCEVVLLGRADEVKGEAAAALQRLRGEAEVAVREVVDEAGLEAVREAVSSAELVIDAVVGTGFKPPLRGLAVVAREMVAQAAAVVVAVDLPSGWDADSMEQEAEGAFRADAVVTFTRPKLAHVFGRLTGTAFGPVVVAEIGSPDAAVVSESGLHWAGAAKAIAEQPRDVNANKGKYGHVLVVGGSSGMAGAPTMASLAAMRTGAGLVTAAVPGGHCATVVARIAPELMVVALKQGTENREQGTENREQGTENREQGTEGLSLGLFEEEALAKLLKGIDVVAVGPGLRAGGNDAGVCARVCGEDEPADGDRCGCAECVCGAGRRVEWRGAG